MKVITPTRQLAMHSCASVCPWALLAVSSPPPSWIWGLKSFLKFQIDFWMVSVLIAMEHHCF